MNPTSPMGVADRPRNKLPTNMASNGTWTTRFSRRSSNIPHPTVNMISAIAPTMVRDIQKLPGLMKKLSVTSTCDMLSRNMAIRVSASVSRTSSSESSGASHSSGTRSANVCALRTA